MAANCVYIRGGDPIPAVGETFLSCDEDVKIEVESGNGFPGNGGCYYGTGKLYVSDRRILFVRSGPNPQFNSFSIPYNLLKKFKLKTPFFSSAHLTGEVSPVPDGGLNGDGTFVFRFGEAELMRSVHNLIQRQVAAYKAAEDKDPWERVGRMGMLPIHEIFQEQFPEQHSYVRESVLQPGPRQQQPAPAATLARPALQPQRTAPAPVAYLNTSIQNEHPSVPRVTSLMSEVRVSDANRPYGLVSREHTFTGEHQHEEEVLARSTPYPAASAHNPAPQYSRPNSVPHPVAPASGTHFVNPHTRPDLFANRVMNPMQREGSTDTVRPAASSNAATPSNALNRMVSTSDAELPPGVNRQESSYGVAPESLHPSARRDARGEGEEGVAYYDENNTGDIVLQLG